MGSLILSCADAHRVEAGGALAVDRHGFARAVTEKVRSHPLITVAEGEVTALPESGNVIVASGPLTSDALAEAIKDFFPESHYLNFFDAAAPLVTFESVDMESAFFASRYDCAPPRRRRFTASRTRASSRAACLWRSWPGGGSRPCATGR